MQKFLSKISDRKIQIKWNKNPIKMDEFLSFLLVEVKPTKGHLGHDNGWTRYIGKNNLQIGGGKVGGVEYLDTLQVGKNLDNPYNNYVNPFYLFDILNNEGKRFFLEYYEEEINNEIRKLDEKLNQAIAELESIEGERVETEYFWSNLKLKVNNKSDN